jgi:hypothetical protein
MANQTLGFGATFTWNGASVAGLTKIGGVEITTEAIDATTHQSPSAFKQFIAGLRAVSDISIEGYFDNADAAGQLAMNTDSGTGVPRTCTVAFPAILGAAWTFSAFLNNCKLADFPMDGLIPFSATIKVTGVPSLGLTLSTGLTTPFFSMNNSAVISPAPAGSVFDYVATVLTGITSIIVTPTASAGVITVNGNVVASGVAASAITLGSAGSITIITIVVTETNKIPRTYIIRVDRP